MVNEIDVRGLSCPQPLIELKKAIDAGETDIILIADDPVARDNCIRMAENEGYSVNVEEKDDEFYLKISKP